MTYDLNAHSNPHINAVLGRICNRPVLAAMLAGMNMLLQNPGKRGGWRILTGLRQQLRDLYSSECTNFELWLRHHLRRNRDWRDRVLADLGGERALRRWERRAAMNIEPNPSRFKTQTRSNRSQPPSKVRDNKGVRTDAQGLFRLAIIKVCKPGSRPGRSSCHSNGSRSISLFPDLRPIGLTPDDLRGPVSACGPDVKIVAIGVSPHDLWSQIMATLMEVHAHLVGITVHIIDAGIQACVDGKTGQAKTLKTPAKDAIANHAVMHPG